jgi:hypothetical protein
MPGDPRRRRTAVRPAAERHLTSDATNEERCPRREGRFLGNRRFPASGILAIRDRHSAIPDLRANANAG